MKKNWSQTEGDVRELTEREREYIFIFIFFSFLFDTWSFDRRNSSGQEQKFIYSTRATREYQKHGISPRIQVRSSENPNFRYSLTSMAFGRSELVGPRDKIDPRIASYAWVPKSWSFVKLHEVRNFPYLE